ncbi:MAG: hypothetical protein QF412_03650, partial [Planctomycetota bacterium]|nr:hypothetical protein [Planctomycetota bacterium]
KADLRYKCWILMRVANDRIASRIEETAKLCDPEPVELIKEVAAKPSCEPRVQKIRVVSGW